MPDDVEGLRSPPDHPSGPPPEQPAEPDTAPVAAHPPLGWLELAVAVVAYLALQLGLAELLIGAFGPTPPAPWLVGLSAVSALGAVALAVAVRVRSPAAVGLTRPSPRVVALGVVTGLVVWLVAQLLSLAYVSLTGDRSDPQEALTQFSGPVAAVLVVAIGGLLVPLGEELLFRGVGYGVLRRFGRPLAVLLTAAVFALAHGLNAVFLAAFVLGIANAVLYERTGTIWASVGAHAAFNLTSFVLVLTVAG